MTTQNGHLPTFLLFPDSSGIWHLSHANGDPWECALHQPLFEGKNLSYETLLGLAKETGASYQIIDPKQRLQEAQSKGNP